MRKNTKRILSAIVMLTSLSCQSHANDFDIKLTGVFRFENGIRHQHNLTLQDSFVSANRRRFAFYSDAAFNVIASNHLDTGVDYGARIVLRTTSRSRTSAASNGSHIFLAADDMGKIELGSPYDAGRKLRITASDISYGSGGRWSAYARLPSAVQFVTGNEFSIDTFITNNPTETIGEPPRKVNFFTPKFKGFSVGLSYIPDSSNGGAGRFSNNSTSSVQTTNISDTQTLLRELVVVDALTGGATFEHNFNEYTGIKLALTGELGKTKPAKLITQNPDNSDTLEYIPLDNLRSYNIGGIVTYCNFSYAASFGSLGKSFTTQMFNGAQRSSKFYNLAAAYSQGPVGASISYFYSNFRGNVMKSFVFGTDYKLASGLLTYFDVTYFNGRGRPLTMNTTGSVEQSRQKYDGFTYVLGLKLQF